MAKYVQPNFIVDSSASFLKNVTFDSSVYLQGVTHISNPAITAETAAKVLMVDSIGVDVAIKYIQLGTMATETKTDYETKANIESSLGLIDAKLLVHDTSIGINQVELLVHDTSIGLNQVKLVNVDTSLGTIWTKFDYVDTSLNEIWTELDNDDSSLNSVWTKFGYVDTSLNNIWVELDALDASYGDNVTFDYVDGSIVAAVDAVDTSLVTYVDGKITNVDTSFGLYETKVNLDSSFGLYQTIVNLDSSFSLYETKVNLDSSLGTVWTKFGYVDTSLNGIWTELDALDASIAAFEANDVTFDYVDGSIVAAVDAVDSSLVTYVNGKITDVDTSFGLYQTIVNLDSSFGLYQTFTNLDISLNAIGVRIDNLDSSLDLYETKANIESSMAVFTFFLGLIDAKLLVHDTSIGINQVELLVHDTSIGINQVELLVHDTSIGLNQVKLVNVDTSLGTVWTKFDYVDTSLNAVWSELDDIDTSFGLYLPLAGGILTGDVYFEKDVYFDGSAYFVDVETLDISAGYIHLNTGLTGVPPASMQSGIVIERGDEDPYIFVFDESYKTFRIGIAGPSIGTGYVDASTQAVATREDTPIDDGLAIYNSTSYRFDTDTNIKYTDIAGLYLNNDVSITGHLDVDNGAKIKGLSVDTQTRALMTTAVGGGIISTRLLTSPAWTAPANLSVTSPLNIGSGSGTNALLVAAGLTIDKATTSIDGYLSSTDWNTFNNKISSVKNPSVAATVSLLNKDYTSGDAYVKRLVESTGVTLTEDASTVTIAIDTTSTVSKYASTFSTDGSTTMYIAAATHGLGIGPLAISVYEGTEQVYTGVDCSSNGNVTLEWTSESLTGICKFVIVG